MKVLVIGAGLIGLTTAYFLRVRGHDVTVIDRQRGPGLETSFANGGLLASSMPEPWNTPGCGWVLLRSLGRSDAPLQLRLAALPSLLGWGFTFLKNSSAILFQRNTLSNLRLALYSLDVLRTLREELRIDYDGTELGIIKIFRDPGSLERAAEWSALLAAEGLRSRTLSPAETLSMQPALAPIGSQLAGALYYPGDEAGDAYRFCVGLADRLQQEKVEFLYNTEVSSLNVRMSKVSGAVTQTGLICADHYIVASGSYSTQLLDPIGIHLPIRPAKGYSLTFDTRLTPSSLRIPVVDDDWHAAVVPIGDSTRVAGTAEFAGFDRTMDPGRLQNLRRFLREVLPEEHFDAMAAKSWCGLRPMSADGVPFVGATGMSNLSLNTGHGHLGWTLAAGSGQLIAQLLSGEPTAIPMAPYDPHRSSLQGPLT